MLKDSSEPKISVFHFFEKKNKGQIKNGICQPLKMDRSYCLVILIKS